MNNYEPPRRVDTSKSDSSQVKPFERQFKSRKRWMIAQSRNVNSQQHKNNITLEMAYVVILNTAKRLFAGTRQTTFERDFNHDNTSTALPMYAFLTDSFYLYLECALDHNYVIQYAFNDCKHEEELNRHLMPLTYIGKVEAVELKPNFAIFYKNTLAFQPKSFQYLL